MLLQAVQQVVTSLQIGHIELRSDDSFDIQQYVHERKVEKIVVPLEGEILDIKNRFLKVCRYKFKCGHICIFKTSISSLYCPYLHYTTPYKFDLGLKRELSLRAFQWYT